MRQMAAWSLRAQETQKSWRRPIFPKGCPLSIFGAGELNFRVRDGNGCGLSAKVTRISCVWTVSAAARRAFARGAGIDLRSRVVRAPELARRSRRPLTLGQ